MSPVAWAGDEPRLPLTSWRDGHLVYVSATPLPLTAAQARQAAQRLLELADAVEQVDPHADAVARLDRWRAERALGAATCLSCGEPLRTHGQCAGCEEAGRRLDGQAAPA